VNYQNGKYGKQIEKTDNQHLQSEQINASRKGKIGAKAVTG
jgi:hypothetical protein